MATDMTGGTRFNPGSDLDLPPAATDRVTLGTSMDLVDSRTGRTGTSQDADPLPGVRWR